MSRNIKRLTANEVVQEMWDKLNDNEKQLVNWLIDKANRGDKAIEYIKACGVLPKQIDSFVLLEILDKSGIDEYN